MKERKKRFSTKKKSARVKLIANKELSNAQKFQKLIVCFARTHNESERKRRNKTCVNDTGFEEKERKEAK